MYSYLEKAIKVESITDNNNNFCQGCRSMVSFASKFNSTERFQDNLNLIKTFCELYYPPSIDFRHGSCDLFVHGVFMVLQKIDPVHHCDEIGACGEVNDKSNDIMIVNDEQDAPPKVGNIVCDVCEQIIQQFQKQIDDPTFIDQLHKQMEAFCDYLKVVDMDKECRQMANKYIDQAIDFIRHVSPVKYCKSIQLCTAAQEKRKQLLAPSLVDFHGFGLETGVELNGQVIRDIDEINPPSIYKTDEDLNEASLTHHKNGPNCMVCKVIVRELSRFIKNNRTEEYIENSLLRVCSLVFKKGSANLEQCNEMVSAYTKELVQLLADESNPEVVCMLIEQCTYQADKNQSQARQQQQLKQQLLTTQSVTTLSHINQQQPTYDNDEQANFGDFINKMDPEIPSNSLRTCVECKLFIRYLQETFQDQKNRESFKEYLIENLCQSLKEREVKDSCTKMVNQYGDYFFKAVAEQLDPGTVCAELKACRKRREPLLIKLVSQISNLPETIEEDVMGHVPPAVKPLNTYRSAVCDQCVDVITKLDEYLSDHSVDHDMSVLIDQVCDKLPDQQSQDTCALIVKTLGQKIIETLHTMDNPKQVCQLIYLC